MRVNKILSKKDMLLILVVLSAAAGLWAALAILSRPGERHVTYGEVLFEGSVVKVVPLDIDQSFSIAERPGVVFEVRGGAIAFVESDCPDQVCVHSGFINSPWHFAVCLPNLLVLSVQAEDSQSQTGTNDVDVIAR